MKVINNTNAEHYKWGQICQGWHLLKNDNLSVIRELVPPGGKENDHYHKHSRQLFFILEGEASIDFSGEIIELKKYDSIEIQPGTDHRLFNKSSLNLEFLVISQPPSHGDRITV